MLRILEFLYRLRALLLFVFLEIIAIWMVVRNNSPQGAAFFNSSMALTGSLLKTQADIVGFFNLAEENQDLASQNAELLQQITLLTPYDSLSEEGLDSAFRASYTVQSARVVGQTLRLTQNHLTINKGSNQGVKEGMGIFNQEGIVGRVKSVSKNYAVGISLLNTGLLVSSKIKSSDVFGSINWDANDPQFAKMLYIPRHVLASPGDTVVTSGYNAIFPEGILIGTISEVAPADDQNYLEITVRLSTDFSKLNHVYLIENTELSELDSLYQKAEISDEY
ncbi:rod shape-determining protein MreC [Algoriphagus kandeliae]|uniref:Cell shape-determining protein MreC n=1 Tax=Algoriphagus kandeliae TaxID=2562278 RepID=A0A4Y9QRP5_9BACT|nr:rod shape-determining protein MreC [Algoriphagus kandeliae]TFV93713.1 rod shape-determining protein MreC [Algoriphagus kandeliae]